MDGKIKIFVLKWYFVLVDFFFLLYLESSFLLLFFFVVVYYIREIGRVEVFFSYILGVI